MNLWVTSTLCEIVFPAVFAHSTNMTVIGINQREKNISSFFSRLFFQGAAVSDLLRDCITMVVIPSTFCLHFLYSNKKKRKDCI